MGWAIVPLVIALLNAYHSVICNGFAKTRNENDWGVVPTPQSPLTPGTTIMASHSIQHLTGVTDIQTARPRYGNICCNSRHR